MANWDLTGGTGSTAYSYDAERIVLMDSLVDLSSYGGNLTGDTVASGDVIKLFNIAAGWVVIAAGITVITAGATSLTLSLGDTGSSTRYISAGTGSSTGYLSGVTPHAYTATDTFEITTGGASTTVGTFYVWAVVVNAANTPTALPAYPGKV